MCGLRSIQIKLVDFGSSQRVNKLGTTVNRVGHPDYMCKLLSPPYKAINFYIYLFSYYALILLSTAPEVWNDEPSFPQTDIWSLGVLTYVMLSGTLPFKGSDESESRQNVNFVRYRFEHLHKEVSQEATRFLMLVFKRTPG